VASDIEGMVSKHPTPLIEVEEFEMKGWIYGVGFRPREEGIGKNGACMILCLMGFTEVLLHASFIEIWKD
jgi:hypothetical protein